MSHVPTVRVASHGDPDNYVTINTDQFDHSVHTLWSTQADDFVPPPPLVRRINPDERELSTRILSKMLAKRHGLTLDDWYNLTPDRRWELLSEAEVEADADPVTKFPVVAPTWVAPAAKRNKS